VAKIVYTDKAIADLERIAGFLSAKGSEILPEEIVDLVSDAVRVLRRHPFIGRQAEAGLRELVISQGSTGYVALYSYEAKHDTILLLAVRHQREAGFGSRST
jgi:addiction module RelE/StbE family toxin